MQRENHPKKTQLKEFAPVALMYNKQAHAFSAGLSRVIILFPITRIQPHR